ncbi:uncharacterized protein LOC130656358 isoform X1 [Hydractinia symbiolongicarpus]|uniref:uncharacterized protein LOC130656358 isoform X1 n=1 Tax=Hydractinia symbiolongicarpus TaxID=13093 RepID=UPI002550372E|nr:uncharacterized protein LOC130656358 isoform X1 [Hydractinia symbiolongicarpus]
MMEERKLRMPPPHLQGPLLVKENTFFGKKWQHRFIMVLPNKFQICENEDECDKRNIMREYNINELDAFETMIPGSSKKYVFKLINDDIEEYYACENAEDLRSWTKNLDILISYWKRKMKMVEEEKNNNYDAPQEDNLMQISESLPRSSNSLSNTFQTVVTLITKEYKVKVTLLKTAVYHDLFTEINKEAKCPNCNTCQIREREARLVVVNPHGQVTFVKKDEELYKYFKAKCQFFLMEQKKMLLVVFFEDEKLLGIPVDYNITTNKILQLPSVTKKNKLLGQVSVGLFYTKEGNESLCAPEETPLCFFYDESGRPQPNPGKLTIKDKTLRRETVRPDESLKRQVEAAKLRAKVKDNDFIRNQIALDLQNRENGKTVSGYPPETGGLGKRSLSFNVVCDMVHPVEALKIERKELAVRSIKLSSGQIIQVTADDDEYHDNTPVYSSSLPEPSIYDPERKLRSRSSVLTNRHERVSNRESVVFDTSDMDPMTCMPIINSDFNILKRIDGLSLDKNEAEETMAAKTQDEKSPEDQVTLAGKKDESVEDREAPTDLSYGDFPTKENINVKGYASEEEINYPDDEKIDTGCVDHIEDDSLVSKNPENECSSDKIDILVHPADDIVKEEPDKRSPSQSQIDQNLKENTRHVKKIKPEEVCKMCAKISVEDRPIFVKSKHTMKWVVDNAQKDVRAQYICLIDTHLRHQDGCWQAVDDSCLSNDLEDSLDKGTTKFNIGNSIFCTWVPTERGKPPKWIVRKVLRNDPIVKQKEPVQEPIESKSSEVEPDPVAIIEESMLDDSSCEKDFDGLERPAPVSTVVILPSVEKMKQKVSEMKVDVKKKAKDFVDTVSQLDFSMEKETEKGEGDITSNEIIQVRLLYIQPLKESIERICSLFDHAPLTQRHMIGDDFQSPDMGRLIRGEFCTIIANFLRVGLTQKNVISKLFRRSAQVSMWSLVKEFSISFKRIEFVSIINHIESSRFLYHDDMCFRFFFCELLNRSTEDGSEKLIVTWFKLFPLASQKAAKFYLENSFWRMEYNMVFNSLLEEIILSLKRFQGCSFNLHIDFEHRIFQNNQEERRNVLAQQMTEEDTVCMME